LNAPVLALGDDRVRVSAGEEITQDDNVFRVSPAAAPSGGGEDTYRTTSVALDVDVPVEEQRFQGNFAVNSQRYDRFDALDLDAHDGSVRWLWKAGGNVDGTIGYRDTLALASLANVQAGVQTAIPNTLDTRASVLETVYRPAARWRLRGGWRSTDQANSAIEYRISDANIDALEAEADYVTRADNRLGLVIRSADGRLPNQQIVGTTFVDNSYSERSIAVLAQWAVTSKSRVAASVGRFERSYAQLPQRGYTGPTYDAKYEWRPTGRVVLEVSAHHGLSPYEEVQVGFVLSRGVSSRLSLGLGDKVTLSLEGEQAHRTYLGDAGLVLGSLPPTSEDLALRSLAVSYKPTPKVELTATLYDAKRVSTLQFSSYSVDTGTLGVRVRF
jgi:exopolysaccharide biosynthesis operon protein EpsL